MEEVASASSLCEPGPSEDNRWQSDIMKKLHAVSLGTQEENLSGYNAPFSVEHGELSSKDASQTLWATGTYCGPIPNGFYSVAPDIKLKELFNNIPSPDELQAAGIPIREEIILVDAEKDKKLFMLKQLSAALVKGQNLNPASAIKKLAGLVSDFYRRPSSELSPAKASSEEAFHLLENRGFQLLGQIRHGSCRPRAMLFKILADAISLESKLVVGLPNNTSVECVDSYKHMSVVVALNSVELLVDLLRFPGQLIPFSSRAILTYHISAAGESDSAENDSCDSPLEPNSPLCEFQDGESNEQDDNIQPFYQRSAELLSNMASSSAQNSIIHPTTFSEKDTSLSHSEPNIANVFWRRSRRKAIVEQRTDSSSPEHPLFRTRGRSILSGDRQTLREYADGVVAPRSDGAPRSDARRMRRRSISITPEIGDNIVRAVRAMNEALKRNRLSKEHGDAVSGPNSPIANSCCDSPKYDSGSGDNQSQISLYNHSGQKAMSLPSSPHDYRGETSETGGASILLRPGHFFTTWNEVLQSSSFANSPLLLFEEWNIDFSELTVGTRVGIGFFGEVFRGIWNGTDVAIKVFLEQDMTTENMEDFCNEISILSRLRHPNVILFLGACVKPPHLSMVTEYMEMGSLYYLIHTSGQRKRLSWRRRFKMLRDICQGLMCIHRMKIIHRDLKSANCLVDRHWTVKICDFGLSRVVTDGPMKDNSSAGTPEWMAPELIRNEPFTEKCDIFSLGVIMWELCTLRRPWEGVPAVQVVYAVANEGTQLEIPDGPLGKLISDCWAAPDERPSCQEVLSRLLDCEYTLC